MVLVLGCVALAGIGRLRGPGRDETSRLRAGRLRTAVAATSLVLIAGGAGLASAQLLRVGSTIRWDRERPVPDWLATAAPALLAERSEERRVGKECRSRWSPYH